MVSVAYFDWEALRTESARQVSLIMQFCYYLAKNHGSEKQKEMLLMFKIFMMLCDETLTSDTTGAFCLFWSVLLYLIQLFFLAGSPRQSIEPQRQGSCIMTYEIQ